MTRCNGAQGKGCWLLPILLMLIFPATGFSNETEPGTPNSLALQYFDASQALYRQKKYQQAFDAFVKGRRLAENADDPNVRARGSYLLGYFHGSGRNSEFAIRNFKQAAVNYESIDALAAAADCYYQIGLTHLSEGQNDSAKFYFENAINSAKALSPDVEGEISFKGLAYYVAVRDFEALNNRISDLSEKVISTDSAHYYWLMSELKLYEKLYTSAERHARKAIELYKKSHRERLMYANGFLTLANILYGQKRFKEALHWLTECRQGLINMQAERFTNLISLYEIDQRSQRLAIKDGEILLLNQSAELQQLALNQKKAQLTLIVIISLLAIVALVGFYLRVRGEIKDNILIKNIAISKKDEQLLDQQKKIAQANTRMSELKLIALRAQIHPTFILNTLNSIQICIQNDSNTKAMKLLSKFSKLLRVVLQNSDKSLIKLRTEIQTLQLFIEIESLRFENSIDFTLYVDEQLSSEDTFVPAMILQPLVEDSIKHAVSRIKRINVQIMQSNGRVRYEIVDNGIIAQAYLQYIHDEKIESNARLISEKLRLVRDGENCLFEITGETKSNEPESRVVIDFPNHL